MPRQARKNLITNFIHIMSQGINKEYIFQENRYKKKYLEILYKKISDYNIKLISYCVMDNHVHLVVYYKNVEDLTEFMSRTNTTYAKWYNDSKNRVGYVFRDRYKTEPITDYHHLISCINYVHNNPVKANIIDKPEQYQYSSYKNYLSDEYLLNSGILELLNLSIEDAKQIFIKSKDSDIYCYREKSHKKIIEDYLKEKNVESVEEIISKKYLKELIKLLKEYSNLRYEEIAKMLKISRSTLYRIRKE